MTKPRLGDRVLLVDDMVDSGHTLEAVHKELPKRFPHIPRSGPPCCGGKRARCSSPTTTSSYLPDNPWIHQPFEVYDNLPPRQPQGTPSALIFGGHVSLRAVTAFVSRLFALSTGWLLRDNERYATPWMMTRASMLSS